MPRTTIIKFKCQRFTKITIMVEFVRTKGTFQPSDKLDHHGFALLPPRQGTCRASHPAMQDLLPTPPDHSVRLNPRPLTAATPRNDSNLQRLAENIPVGPQGLGGGVRPNVDL